MQLTKETKPNQMFTFEQICFGKVLDSLSSSYGLNSITAVLLQG